MKSLKKYLLGAAALCVAALGFTACQDDFDNPNIAVPVAKNQPTITIAELKKEFWQEGVSNYAVTVPEREDGSHYIVHGRVVSSDEGGNVFKNLVIDDGTAALPFSINSYNLYLKYRRGQEIVVDLTGMDIGMYNGYMQVGLREWYENGNAWEVSFMAPETFTRQVELNGLPDISAVDTLQVNSFDQLRATPEGLQQLQGRLVRFNNVRWQNAGVETFSTYHSSGVSQNIIDVNDATLAVRTSGYSNFWNKTLPEGNMDVVCILGYYGSAWQLTLMDYEGCMNIGHPTTAPGAETNPYSVAEAVALEASGSTASNVWVKGYIVGTVAPEVENVTGNDDVEWGVDPILTNTVVIASNPASKNVAECLVLALPEGSVMREYVNIQAHPENVGKELTVRGTLEKYMGTFGLTGNRGTASEFKLEGVEIPDEGGAIANGDGTQASPYNSLQVIAKNPTSTSEAVESGVWVKGYIVGSMPAEGTYIDKTIFGPAAELKTNIVIAPTADCTDASKCVGLQLPNNDIRSTLNLMEHPENIGKAVAVKGDIMKYCGGPGVKNITAYEFEGGGTVDPTPDPVGSVLFSTTFQDGTLGQFTVENKVESAFSGWYAKTNGYPQCAMANSYVNGANVAAESWLISPAINLAGCSELSMSVKHAFGWYFPTAQDEFCTVLVQADGGEWTALTLTNYPPQKDGNWTDFVENTFDFNAYAGKTIRVAFRYVNDGAKSRAWELQDFQITGKGNAAVDPTPGPTPDPDPEPDPDPTPGEHATATASDFALSGATGTATVGGYTFTVDKKDGVTNPFYHEGTNAIRLYNGGTLNVKGAGMVKIVVTLASDAKFRYTTFTPSTGKLEPAQAAGDTSITWVGDATDVTFTVGEKATMGTDGESKKGQIRFTSVEVFPAE